MNKIKKIFIIIIAVCLLLGSFAYIIPFFTASAQTDATQKITEPQSEPQVTAESALLVSLDSGVTLYSKNAEEKVFPASTTKIMTALLILENVKDLNTTVKATLKDYLGIERGSSIANLQDGEELTYETLLKCILIASANEACNTAANNIAGSVDKFVEMMNKKAKELGCSNTNFVNTHGLHDDNHYTTAKDMYRIAAKALEYDKFREICQMTSFTLPPIKEGNRIYITTNNLIVKNRGEKTYYKYAKGVKTGHTEKAGDCLVSLADNGKYELLSIVYKDSKIGRDRGSFISSKAMFEWGYNNYSIQNVVKKGDPVHEVKINQAKSKDFLILTTDKDFNIPVKTKDDIEKIQKSYNVKKSITAPIKKGDILGEVTFSLNGEIVGSRNLVAMNGIEQSKFLYYMDTIGNFFKNPIVLSITIIVALLIVVYVIYVLLYLNRKKQYKRVNRRRRF